MKLSSRQLATVLAALRYWQSVGIPEGPEHEIATNEGEFEAMDESEIDSLCQDLNCAE